MYIIIYLTYFGAITLTYTKATENIKGPPRSDHDELQIVGRVGDTLRMQCPIEGYPIPMIEWSKGGEKIDFTWTRYKVAKKYLKIIRANKGDTDVFICKGINGFGSHQVRIELIIVDPKHYSVIQDGDNSDGSVSILAAPVFTRATNKLSTTIIHFRSVGEKLYIVCQALGRPTPTVKWFKDGRSLQSSLKTFRQNHVDLTLSLIDQSDAGVYTCVAKNVAGEERRDYHLEVMEDFKDSSSYNSMLLTDSNTTVIVGNTARISCRIHRAKSTYGVPNIKWLKKLNPSINAVVYSNVIKIGSDKYKLLESDKVTRIAGTNEYISNYIIPKTSIKDGGIYICFISSSELGPLTFKSAWLNVVSGSDVSLGALGNMKTNIKPTNKENSYSNEILYVVSIISIITLLLLILTSSCLLRKQHKLSDTLSSPPETPDRQLMVNPMTTTSASSDLIYLHCGPQTSRSSSSRNSDMGSNQMTLTVNKLAENHWPNQWSPRGTTCGSSWYPSDTLSGHRSTTDIKITSNNNNEENSRNKLTKSPNQYDVPYSHLYTAESENILATPKTSKHLITAPYANEPLRITAGIRRKPSASPPCNSPLITPLKKSVVSNGSSVINKNIQLSFDQQNPLVQTSPYSIRKYQYFQCIPDDDY